MADKKPRRGAGDGALFKRADGYWVGGVELAPGPDGKRRVKRIVRKNRNDCVEALRNLKKDVAAGRITGAKSTTVEKWLEHWQSTILPTRTKGGKPITPATMTSYRGTIRRYLIPNIGAKRLDKLSPADIRALYDTVSATVSTRAAQQCHQVLALAIDAAVRDGILGYSIMDKVDKPAHLTKESVAFDAATVLHILNTALEVQGQMWAARWLLGFTSGVRESEILGLERDRLHLDDCMIDISWQLHRAPKIHGCGGTCGKKRPSFCPKSRWDIPAAMQWRPCAGTLVFTRPKTRAGMRVVPLLPDVADILRKLPDDWPNPHGLVFHHPDGRPISTEDDQRAWRDLLRAAGVPHAGQHSIRHSTATLLLEAGVDVHIVQTVIGHSDAAMTRHYQHVDLELARRAWSNLSALLPVGPTG